MNIQQLKCAVEVWKCGSISKAAERLYMNQPNLSRLIKALESEFHITLFSRTTSGVDPTLEGLRFLREAESIVERTESFEQAFKSNPSDQFTFRIAVPRVSYIASAFSASLAPYSQKGCMRVTYREAGNHEIIQCVSTRDYDIGIIRFPIDFEAIYKRDLSERQLKYQEIMKFRFVVIMSRKHPLAARRVLRFQDLSPYTILIHGDNYSVRFSDRETDQLYKTHIIKNEITIFDRGIQFDLLRDLPGTFMLVSPVPQEVLDANGLVQIRLAENEVGLFEDLLIMQRNRHFTEFEQEFLNQLTEAEQELTGMSAH